MQNSEFKMQNAEFGTQMQNSELKQPMFKSRFSGSYRATLIEDMASSAKYDERTNGPLAQ